MRELWLRIALLAVASALLGHSAAAQPADEPTEPVRLEVECGLAWCPDAGQLRARLVKVLGADPITERAARAARTVRVRYAAGAPGVLTEISLYTAETRVGERRFATAVDDWPAVLDAAAMNIAMIVEPGRVFLPPIEPEPAPVEPAPVEPAPPVETAPIEPEPTPTNPLPAPDTSEPGHLELGLGGGVSGGLSPGTSGTLRLTVGRIGPRSSGEVALRWDPDSAAAFAGGEVTATTLALDLAGCLRWRWAVGCATGLLGGQRASSTGLPEPRAVTMPIAAIGARARLTWPLDGAFFARLDLDGRLPLSRTRLRIGGNLAWQSAPVAGDITLTAGARF